MKYVEGDEKEATLEKLQAVSDDQVQKQIDEQAQHPNGVYAQEKVVPLPLPAHKHQAKT